jgi:hypothetical protein
MTKFEVTEPEYMNPDGTVGKIISVSDRTIVGCTFPLSNELGIDIQDVSDVVPTAATITKGKGLTNDQ